MRPAKIFKNRRSQAVGLPAEFRFEGDEVLIRRDPVTGDVILRAKPTSLDSFFRLRDRLLKQSTEEFSDFLVERDPGFHIERDWP